MPERSRLADNPLPDRPMAWLTVMATLVVAVLMAAATGDTAAVAGDVPTASDLAVTPITTTTIVPPGACRITVIRPGALLRAEPSGIGRELRSVPTGEYVVTGVATVAIGTDQDWLRLEVGGGSGWVRDSTRTIGERSSGCI